MLFAIDMIIETAVGWFMLVDWTNNYNLYFQPNSVKKYHLAAS